MELSSKEVAEILRELDTPAGALVGESQLVQLSLQILCSTPPVSDLLIAPGITDWRRGPNHSGDLVGYNSEGVMRNHLEIKSANAQVNVSEAACPRPGCPNGGKTQFHHMLEDGVPVYCLGPAGSRTKDKVKKYHPDLLHAIEWRTWSDLADAIESAYPFTIPFPLRSILGLPERV